MFSSSNSFVYYILSHQISILFYAVYVRFLFCYLFVFVVQSSAVFLLFLFYVIELDIDRFIVVFMLIIIYLYQ